ncbi:glycosyltransferase family 2 protein [Candidatus Curtissbacteria bacterium]|nr:glycosyltransferase family 2 protein [Candidatus Curtissbacteria bacterium]
MKTNPLVSIIIPVYNEEKVITGCLESLAGQNYKNTETIIVDDGSSDKTLNLVRQFKVQVLEQKHLGPGVARNLGATKAKGEILVFVDADMTFDRDFVTDLTAPIVKGETIGTFSKNEMVQNSDNPISICWNVNRNLPKDRMVSPNSPNHAQVYRAILKDKFESVGGFDTDGQYIDDWSLSRKLKTQSTMANGAKYFHTNPSTFDEVWKQARWIGKNDFISGSLKKRIVSLVRYCFPVSILIGVVKSIKYQKPLFIIFKIYYDFATTVSILESSFSKNKSK